MGIVHKQDWTSKWITARGAEKYAPVIEPTKTDFITHRINPASWMNKMQAATDPNYNSILFRKEFTTVSKLVRAVVHLSRLGSYELTINGKKVGNDLLSPGWSGL